MKLQQLKKAIVKKINNKLFLQLPEEIINDLSITDSDHFIISLKQEVVTLRKSIEIDISDVVYSQLSTLFKSNDEIIAKWLQTPKTLLENKAPIEMLNTEHGIESILDLIKRLKTGDF